MVDNLCRKMNRRFKTLSIEITVASQSKIKLWLNSYIERAKSLKAHKRVLDCNLAAITRDEGSSKFNYKCAFKTSQRIVKIQTFVNSSNISKYFFE